MTAEQQNLAIAMALQVDEWLIVKRGYYYRPGACGYTSNIAEAWKLPHAEAKKHEMYATRTDVDAGEKVLIERAPIPNYCGDLNAIAKAEEALTADQYAAYIAILWPIGHYIRAAVSAKAETRAAALVKALNLWIE